ncbi:alpha/beta hydrolase [Sorangium sp. So ce1078]|uniref:alpha/beta hydrolase n=1 Tax=Sorangium sp. So ce1078 TaxID=3133329 RepID=UPI003F61B3E6
MIVAAAMHGAIGCGTETEAKTGDLRVHEERVGPRLVDLTIESSALGATTDVRLLTPDGWEERQESDRWPVLYLLHGAGDTYESWTRDSDVEELPELRDVLVVMPDGGPAGFYSDWWNYGRGGPPAWETFHLDELRSLLESAYGAGTSRSIAGLSMGGFGAISYAARRPGMFRAAASYSGDVHLLHPSFVEAWQGALEGAQEVGIDLAAVWGDPVAQRDVWEAHDPYHLVEKLKGTAIFLACGDGAPGPLDPPDATEDAVEVMVNEMNRSLADHLEKVGIPRITHFYAGTHAPQYWERELHESLPTLLQAL